MNTLKKLSGFDGVKGPVLTIVMDGIGLAPDTVSNAVATSYTLCRRNERDHMCLLCV